MTHLEVENLASDYLEGQLEAGLKAQVEAHLNTCPSCLTMVEDVRRAMELCHATPELEPAPWLVEKIIRATIGERKPSLAERLLGYFRPVLQTRFAYGIAMAVFSFSIIINAAGVNLRHMTFRDLNPLTWRLKLDRAVNLYLARGEKFINDLKVVYEVESRLRQLRSHPEEEQQAPKPESPAGGSMNTTPLTMPALAYGQVRASDVAGRAAMLQSEIEPPLLTTEPVRSQNP